MQEYTQALYAVTPGLLVLAAVIVAGAFIIWKSED